MNTTSGFIHPEVLRSCILNSKVLERVATEQQRLLQQAKDLHKKIDMLGDVKIPERILYCKDLFEPKPLTSDELYNLHEGMVDAHHALQKFFKDREEQSK